MNAKQSLDELISFGKELGFEATNRGVLLPLDTFEGYEYGVLAGDGLPFVYFKTVDSEEIVYGEKIPCFTPQIVLKTLKVNENEFLIERKDEDKLRLNSKGLILSFMYKDKGSIDSSFLNLAWSNLLRIVPKKIVEKYVGAKVDELSEKLNEVNNLNDFIDEKDLQKITGLLVDELFIYGKLNPKIFKKLENQNIQQIYEKLIKKGRIYNTKDLLDWSGIKPEFKETFVQEGYEKLIKNRWIYTAKQLLDFSGIKPKESIVQEGYEKLIKNGWIDNAKQLLDFSGIIPKDENIKKILLIMSSSPKRH